MILWAVYGNILLVHYRSASQVPPDLFAYMGILVPVQR